MNKTEYLIVKLIEECVEVAQRGTKALTFGLDEIQEGQTLTNRQRLLEECIDLTAILEMCHDMGIMPNDVDFYTKIDAKKAKVKKYMEYSKKMGCLNE